MLCCQSWLLLSCISQCWCRPKLEMEICVIIWLLQKIVTEMTTDHWFKICEKNNDEWHKRNMQIKYAIIIIFQYTISEKVYLLFNIKIFIIKPTSITHPCDFDCRITNNTPCIICEHLIRLPITGRFSKLGLIALNRVNNNRDIFKVRSPIKIQSMLSPGIGQLITLTGYSSGLT